MPNVMAPREGYGQEEGVQRVTFGRLLHGRMEERVAAMLASGRRAWAYLDGRSEAGS